MRVLYYLNKLVKESGFVYLSFNDGYENISIGDIIEVDTRMNSPFVVESEIEKITVANWPGELFEVEIINLAKDKILNTDLLSNASFKRASGIRIIQKLNVSKLFGNNGKNIVELLETIDIIEYMNLEEFPKLINDEARLIYNYAWQKWKGETKTIQSVLMNDNNTLKEFSTKYKGNSPINEGLAVIYSQVSEQAKKVSNNRANVEYSYGNVYLSAEWSLVSEVFLHAGMSYENFGLLDEKLKYILRKALSKLEI